MLSFAFDASKETPQSVAQKRALIAQIMGTARAPKNIGEGFSAIGDGIVANVEGGRAREAEAKGQESANSTFGALTAMLTGQGGSSQPSAYGSSPGIPSTADAASIRAGLIERGLPEHVADGFLMNFQDESGLNPGINEQNPTVPGSPGGYGLYQLTGPRRVAYEQYAQQMGVDPSDVNAQLDFMMSELQGPEARAAQSIMAAPDAGTAAAAIARDFLRPAQQHLDERVSRYTAGNQPGNYTPRTEMATVGLGVPKADGTMGGSVTQEPIGYNVWEPQQTQVASLDPSIGAQPAQLPPVAAPQTAQAAPMAPPAPMPTAPAPVQSAQGPSLQMLMEAAANPWLNDSQKAIINSMISQEMQKQDPAYQQSLQAGQLGIDKTRLEIDAMRNPPAAAPAPVKYEVIDGKVVAINPNDNTAAAIGDFAQPAASPRPMTPEDRQMWGIPASDTTPYYLDENGQPKAIGGGGQTINVGGQGEIGTIPPDYELITDPVTGARSMRVIPGSPSDIKAQADAAAAQATVTADQDQASRYGNVVVEDIDRALAVLDTDPTWSTGILGQAMGNFKGSSSDRLNNLLDTVRANSAFDRLQAMRDASPTGGALGAVSERELGLLQSAIGSLETGNAEDLAYNLKRLQTIYSEIIDGPSAATNQTTVAPGDIDALLEKYQ